MPPVEQLGWPKRYKSTQAFLLKYSNKRLKSAQLLGQLAAFLTCTSERGSCRLDSALRVSPELQVSGAAAPAAAAPSCGPVSSTANEATFSSPPSAAASALT